MFIIANYLKPQGKLAKDTIVATVMSNLGLNKYAEANKLNFVQTKVGDRYVLEEMLKNGYNLGGEQSGHVILLDHMMPEIDGEDALKEIKKEGCINHDTPVIVLTAYVMAGAREKYIEKGFDDYLSKPVSGEDLEDMLIKYIKKEKNHE